MQIWYLWTIEELNAIAISSMIFSAISIVVTIISIMTTKQILDSQGYAVVKFDVTGSVSNKCDECRNKTRKIRKSIANELGLNTDLIEIQRPRKIPNGLQMVLEIYLNHIKSRNIDYEKKLYVLYENGKLAEILKTSWDLQMAPTILSFEFQVKESKNRIKGAVAIKVNSNTVETLPQNILPPQPAINITDPGGDINDIDDDNAESGSDDIMHTNGIIKSGEIDHDEVDHNDDGKDHDNQDDDNKSNVEMHKLDDKKESFIELYNIEGVLNEEKPAQKKEEKGKDWDVETMQGGLQSLSDRQISTAF